MSKTLGFELKSILIQYKEVFIAIVLLTIGNSKINNNQQYSQNTQKIFNF